ncbi:MAG TPA: hypothetical protein VFV50_08145 [Bdellovibrionales bacterium]|nr:hypothetical protein [Bdellovibrionales bacterium]
MRAYRFSVLILGGMLTACYQQAREYNVSSEYGDGDVLAPSYSLVSPQAIIDSMTSAGGLALSTNNESVADIRNRRIELGDADPVNRIARNSKASAGKFKTILENYINACSDSVGFTATPSTTQQTNRTRLFAGASAITETSFDSLFLTFVGRLPLPEERAALLDLTATVSNEAKWASACAAILASMEPLNGT